MLPSIMHLLGKLADYLADVLQLRTPSRVVHRYYNRVHLSMGLSLSGGDHSLPGLLAIRVIF
jgi:hypothetical protein